MSKLRVMLTATLLVASLTPIAAGASTDGARVDPWLQPRLAGATGPLTVFVHADRTASATRAATTAGLAIVERFEKAGIVVATGPAAAVRRTLRDPAVIYVEGDRPIEFAMQSSHAATRGDTAIAGFTAGSETSDGVDGSGVSIAIVDTGIDGTHPMFSADGSGKVVRNLKLACHDVADVFVRSCSPSDGDTADALWVDAPDNDSDSPSAGGHGTHVAGIAAGSRVTMPGGAGLHGAAPGASLVGLSVGATAGMYGGASALNWILEHHAAPCGPGVIEAVCPPIKVANNSWGIPGGAFNPALAASRLSSLLTAEGVTVVWSAGNGTATGTGGDGSTNNVNPYAQNPTPGVIGVANYDDGARGSREGQLAPSSSRGLAGSPATYPDLSAPGTNITSACRATLPICGSLVAFGMPDFGTISGTSMAAPHVSGIVAQLIQAGRQSLGRDLTPPEIEDILEDTAHAFTFGAAYEPDVFNSDHPTSFDKGHGLVDAAAAVARVRAMQAPAAGASPSAVTLSRRYIASFFLTCEAAFSACFTTMPADRTLDLTVDDDRVAQAGVSVQFELAGGTYSQTSVCGSATGIPIPAGAIAIRLYGYGLGSGCPLGSDSLPSTGLVTATFRRA